MQYPYVTDLIGAFFSGKIESKNRKHFSNPEIMQKLMLLNIDFAFYKTDLVDLTQTSLYAYLWEKQTELFHDIVQAAHTYELTHRIAVSQGFGLSLRLPEMRFFGYRADIDFQVTNDGEEGLRAVLSQLGARLIGIDDQNQTLVELTTEDTEKIVYDNATSKVYLGTFVDNIDLSDKDIKFENSPLLLWEKPLYAMSIEATYRYAEISNDILKDGFIAYKGYNTQNIDLEIATFFWRLREYIKIGSLRPRILFDFLYVCMNSTANEERVLMYIQKFGLVSFALDTIEETRKVFSVLQISLPLFESMATRLPLILSDETNTPSIQFSTFYESLEDYIR